MFTIDIRMLKQEGVLLNAIEKMVEKLPTFPSETMKKGGEMDELETLRTAITKLTEHAYVRTALRTPTCREEKLGRMVLDMPTLLWNIIDKSLAKSQRVYLEELAPGGSEGEAWQQRFTTVNQFMGDLALSVGISVDTLKRLKTELLVTEQRTAETAAAFYTRVSTRWETVNFVADVVEGCAGVSRRELLGIYWAGLTHSTLVGTRLLSLALDTSRPELWEQRQRGLGHKDTSAILQVREVATMIEEEKIKEEAGCDATGGGTSEPLDTPSTCVGGYNLEIIGWRGLTGGGGWYSASIQAARLARRQAQVAACVAVINGEVDEDSLDVEETEMLDEEVSTLAALDAEGYEHMCEMCGIEEQLESEEAFREWGSEGIPETRH
ncbi:hypothetical protein CYMTET_41967 [Cymbomonas tetramitiformis]|uniref:Uncharacterized protein n=1 Tax=Cymbomonas tetramitiformis TaxID=36881 RepID=A0AAE0F1P9_9CHLO|nr:hypothetical protein CYMTET_41967 [Cymbomonas tetramitiformis]